MVVCPLVHPDAEVATVTVEDNYGHESQRRVIKMKPEQYSNTKTRLLNSMLPVPLVPLGTANVMLVLGSKKTKPSATGFSEDCAYDLPLLFLLTGVVSMGLILLGLTCKSIVDWIFENR